MPLVGAVSIDRMAMNSETPKHGGGGGAELEKRVSDVEARLTVIEKTMVTAEVFQRELGAFRDEMRMAFERLLDQMHAGFDQLRKADGALRDEMHSGFDALRKADGALRDEMHAGFDELRKADGALRDEMHAGFDELRKTDAALRDEMHVGFGELRKDMHALNGALRVEIAKTPFETFKWLLTAAGLAAAIATAIYNIWFR